MTRIQDIAAFNEVREAGLAKLLPSQAAHRRGHGHLRLGQRGRGRLPGLRLRDRRPRPGRPARPRRLLRLLRRGAARQRLGAGPAAPHPPPGAAEPRGRHPGRARAGQGPAAGARALQDRGVGPPHRPREVRIRLPRAAALARGPLLQGPGQDRPPQLRPPQPGRHRGVHRGRRLPGPLQGPDRLQPGGGHRAAEGGQAARPGRGGVPHRQQVGVPARRTRPREVPRLQRGRGRPRRLHEPQRDRERPALAARGDADRRLRDRHAEGHPLRARGVPAGRAPARARDRAGPRLRRPRRQRPRPRVQVRHRARGGGGRLRLRRGDGAHRLSRGPVRAPAAAAALSRPEGPPRQADEHQQRRDLVQHRADRLQGPGLVHRDRERQEPGHQGLLPRGQGAQHGPRRDAPRHADREVHLRHRGGRHERPGHQGRSDRRALRRLHPRRHVRDPGGLREPRPDRLDHGLRRHGRDGRRQLHGGRRPLLHRVHPLGELREVRPLPGGPGQGAADPEPPHRGRRHPGRPRLARRAVPHGARHVAVRPRPERAQPRPHHAAALPARVRGPHPGQALPRRRVRGPRALPLRELVPAAHEHPALPGALQGGAARGRVPVRRSSTTRCPPPPGACASTPATTGAGAPPWTRRSTCGTSTG